jgi:hypothetical protein
VLTGGAAVVGSAAGAVLLGAADAEAANGSPVLAGRVNTATAATSLTNTSTSGAAHGLLISTRGGYGFQTMSTSNHGAAGITSAPSKAGVLATHNGPTGTGAALIANGRMNIGASIKSQGGNAAITAEHWIDTAETWAIGGSFHALQTRRDMGAIGLLVSVNVVDSLNPFPPVAIRAYGNVEVLGELTKTSGSFRIDHPLDPANKYLSHSFVESPDMANVYNGTVEADDKGEATVELPAWFDALNKDLRYHLTPIGGPAPDLHVKSEVADRRFVIAGAKKGQKVCWQLIGTRKDAWANAHRVQVEQNKPANERGTYVFPRGFGQPESKRLGHRVLPTKR